MIAWLRARARRKGHPHSQRRSALLMVIFGLARMSCWLTLIVLYLAGVPFTHSLLAQVTFVALISLYANAATDFGQVAASLAQLTAADAHHAASVDFAQIDSDVARLADLQPGPEAKRLASEIRKRLTAGG